MAFLALPGVVAFALPIAIGISTHRPVRYLPLAAAVLALGTLLLLWCVREFYVAGRGTLAPWSPPRRLVTSGPYRWSRNPMYLGVVTILCGWCLLWDSRTVHCSSPALEAPDNAAALMRAVSLVCMMPRRLTPDDVLEQRKRAVEGVISTTNWTDKFINADKFPQITNAPGIERYRRPPVPKLSDEQRKLVGY